jgi:hypothetical protein
VFGGDGVWDEMSDANLKAELVYLNRKEREKKRAMKIKALADQSVMMFIVGGYPQSAFDAIARKCERQYQLLLMGR